MEVFKILIKVEIWKRFFTCVWKQQKLQKRFMYKHKFWKSVIVLFSFQNTEDLLKKDEFTKINKKWKQSVFIKIVPKRKGVTKHFRLLLNEMTYTDLPVVRLVKSGRYDRYVVQMWR
jgi:hypothetical protein